MDDELRCLDSGGKTPCGGPVEYRTLPDNPRSFPRCEAHFDKRLEQSPRNLEYQSPARPAWFDEANIGERWEDDY
jgi:hypothetical protein